MKTAHPIGYTEQLFHRSSPVSSEFMVEDNQQYAYFTITGSFDPIDITERIGVLPTECWQQGEISHRTHIERKFSRWSLHSRLERNNELDAHIRDVLAQLDTNATAFAAVSQEFGGWMQLVAYFHLNYPGLNFDRDITAGLARYSLAVDFDFYWLYSHDRESTD
ncbi:DUF4279 domain-containing protein [Chamaesiphon sp. VAR_48_metabat_403]|uniref:DUF4279 domain-containing protein n=1 Tax=Chamaesiphon sp. VAR_48_metabat_403 TaxID=2964700 RepID=UPI00286DC8A8|nr:DUF4279 domain-containing protein [Chamaesiphon sp. VAR_48_metabat_403]